ncbi:MAG: hypothetical protein Q7T05_08525 [Dehalococcoidia bacterium]|nr:hypothetical protein [Dehalococcoidia bacterium]
MSALNELRRHFGIEWKKMGREETKSHLKQSLKRIADEQQKLAEKTGAGSVAEMERLFMAGQFKGKEAASYMHQYNRMCSLTRMAQQALEELEAPDPDAVEDEFEGIKQY